MATAVKKRSAGPRQQRRKADPATTSAKKLKKDVSASYNRFKLYNGKRYTDQSFYPG